VGLPLLFSFLFHSFFLSDSWISFILRSSELACPASTELSQPLIQSSRAHTTRDLPGEC
jgi:hypothetical protein